MNACNRKLRLAAGLWLAAAWMGVVSAAELTLANAGFEDPASGTEVPGWEASQHVGEDAYEILLDRDKPAKGKHSLRIKRLGEQIYGAVEQTVPLPADLAGKSMEVAALLKTKDVGAEGWLLVATFKTAAHGIIRQVRAAPATGSSDWKRVSLEAKVPQNARSVSLSLMLMDKGTGWADDVRVTVE